MNITEATHVNRLADFLTGKGRTKEDAVESLAYLADRANKPLMCGWTGEKVRAEWRPEDPADPLGDPPPELADAWARYQRGGTNTLGELNDLDEWRAERAQAAGF